MSKKEIETFYPINRKEWRLWLKNNHSSSTSIWVIFYKKNTQFPTISWSEAVDEALCFGWIDSIKKSIDNEKYIQFFSQRKPQSTWSKINKDKVDSLIRQKLMTPTGINSIEIAKQNGSWTILDNVEKLMIPKDLEKAFESKPNSKEYFLGLSKSKRKEILSWIVLAKRTETREKRIREIAEFGSENMKTKTI
ncbi:hypothetical protein FF125_02625 [Aureibaculum algae]|uniref:Bacteriocin-protection protein n=1 Tax=Aureibaculum algae TaxID=2584122 RepID=A0A5B7TQD2_9FLAO|nr:YdeI/OmpD-associated family protein [Aureibaculum algae]QCX37383.1 hypothetical protein FF125_02625 [Aureibaculum algae]